MLRLLGVTAAALVLAATATAADIQPPAGFTLSTSLSKPVSFVTGKPAKVYCADTQAHFNAADQQYTGVVLGAGFSQIGSDQTFLAPGMCSYLNRWNGKRLVTKHHLAQALVAIIHEAEIEKGESDESRADCEALAIMPAVVQKFFPLHSGLTMHALMREAWDVHNAEPEIYLLNCPAR